MQKHLEVNLSLQSMLSSLFVSSTSESRQQPLLVDTNSTNNSSGSEHEMIPKYIEISIRPMLDIQNRDKDESGVIGKRRSPSLS